MNQKIPLSSLKLPSKFNIYLVPQFQSAVEPICATSPSPSPPYWPGEHTERKDGRRDDDDFDTDVERDKPLREDYYDSAA